MFYLFIIMYIAISTLLHPTVYEMLFQVYFKELFTISTHFAFLFLKYSDITGFTFQKQFRFFIQLADKAFPRFSEKKSPIAKNTIGLTCYIKRILQPELVRAVSLKKFCI